MTIYTSDSNIMRWAYRYLNDPAYSVIRCGKGYRYKYGTWFGSFVYEAKEFLNNYCIVGKKKRKPKVKKFRDWNAINSHGRNSQGPMKDRLKQKDKDKCRKSKQKRVEE